MVDGAADGTAAAVIAPAEALPLGARSSRGVAEAAGGRSKWSELRDEYVFKPGESPLARRAGIGWVPPATSDA